MYKYITFPARWRPRSTAKEIETITEQTRATTHVGVYSKVVPPPAILVPVILDIHSWSHCFVVYIFCSVLTNYLFLLNYGFQIDDLIPLERVFYNKKGIHILYRLYSYTW